MSRFQILYLESLFGISIWNIYLESLFGIFIWNIYLEYLFGIFIWNTYLEYLFGILIWNTCYLEYSYTLLGFTSFTHLVIYCGFPRCTYNNQSLLILSKDVQQFNKMTWQGARSGHLRG